MTRKSLIAALVAIALVQRAQGESPAVVASPKVPSPSEVIFEDRFERSELGASWRVAIGDFHIQEGRLVGNERPEDKHGAVTRAKSSFKDGIVEFDFLMGDVKTCNFVIDQRGFSGSHAGHLCRVVVTPTRLRLADDKEGAMRNDIYAMKDDPTKVAQREALLKDRSVTFPVKFDPRAWHTMSVEIIEDRMRVRLDGKEVGQLQSPGLAHEEKTDIGFTVLGQGARFDNMRILKSSSSVAK